MIGESNTTEKITVFIGVGSNIGDRYKNILSAEQIIDTSNLCEIIRVSKLYETEPVGYLDQDKFLNCVFEIKTLLSPHELLKLLMEAEKKLKRKRIIHWGPPTIDLDILFFDDLVIYSPDLIIPHPRMHDRMFVLKPLCDLVPNYVHPVLNEPCYRIAESLETDQAVPKVWLPEDNISH